MTIAIIITSVLFSAAGFAFGWRSRDKEVAALDRNLTLWRNSSDQYAKSWHAAEQQIDLLRRNPPRIVGTQPPPIGWPFKEDDHG